jgi:hypothetical protein
LSEESGYQFSHLQKKIPTGLFQGDLAPDHGLPRSFIGRCQSLIRLFPGLGCQGGGLFLRLFDDQAGFMLRLFYPFIPDFIE